MKKADIGLVGLAVMGRTASMTCSHAYVLTYRANHTFVRKYALEQWLVLAKTAECPNMVNV